jgi:DNA-binding transcriptional ArsR family regulator
MAQMLPRRPSVERGEGLRLEAIDDEAADQVFDALSSGTARSILAAVYDDPAPASELAEAADTSLQNARYHIEKLVDAELIEAADTWYSEQGREMTVYAPADESLVVVAGEPGRIASLRGALRQVVGAIGALAAGSVLAGAAIRHLGGASQPAGGAGGDAAAPAIAAEGGGDTAESEAVGTDSHGTGGDGGVGVYDTTGQSTRGAANATPQSTNGTPANATAETVTATPDPSPTPTRTIPTETPGSPGSNPDVSWVPSDLFGATGPPPEFVFFLGGLFVLVMVSGWLHWSGRWSRAA